MTITPPVTAIVFDLFHTLVDTEHLRCVQGRCSPLSRDRDGDADRLTIDQLEMVLIGLVDPGEE